MADLYSVVADKIREFCEATYYGDVVVAFEQSYDGKSWDRQVEFASFENSDFESVVFNSDWCEGQSHIRNLKVWHLEDSEEVVVHCANCVYAEEPPKEDEGFVLCKKCSTWVSMFITHPDDFCSWGERKEL